jgi:hypothetical protein
MPRQRNAATEFLRRKPVTLALNVRTPPDLLSDLDAWIADQGNEISRPAALRIVAGEYLKAWARRRRANQAAASQDDQRLQNKTR